MSFLISILETSLHGCCKLLSFSYRSPSCWSSARYGRLLTRVDYCPWQHNRSRNLKRLKLIDKSYRILFPWFQASHLVIWIGFISWKPHHPRDLVTVVAGHRGSSPLFVYIQQQTHERKHIWRSLGLSYSIQRLMYALVAHLIAAAVLVHVFQATRVEREGQSFLHVHGNSSL